MFLNIRYTLLDSNPCPLVFEMTAPPTELSTATTKEMFLFNKNARIILSITEFL